MVMRQNVSKDVEASTHVAPLHRVELHRHIIV